MNVFAVIEDFRQGSSDILTGLTPFFEPLLLERYGQTFDPNTFAGTVRDRYKWNFTSDIAEELIPRFVSMGWLTADDNNRDSGPYTVTIPERQNTEAENRVLAQFESIAESFRSFAESLSPLTALNRSIEDYKDILIEWLLYVDAYSEANLDFTVETVQSETGKLYQRADIPRTTSLGNDDEYLCARFVEQAIEQDDKIAEVLCQIASIGLLTEVVQDFVRPTTAVDASDLIVYLDAPIAMEMIGVSGKAAQENVLPVIEALQSIGVAVRIFSISVDEISRNLRAVLAETNRTGPTARALAQGSVLEAFVRTVAANPISTLEEYGVDVTERSLTSNPGELSFFDNERYQELYTSLTFQFDKPAAREHDASVASFIVRMRRGRWSPDIFDAKYLLLTRNGIFAQQTKKACLGLAATNPRAVPPVVHRRVLATAAWLRTGLTQNAEQIPKRLLLASCERVLSIKPGVVRAVKKFSDELNEKKAAQLDTLLAQDRSAQLLMDKTLGVSQVVSAENISELFDEMVSPYLEDQKEEHEAHLKSVEQENKKKIAAERQKTKKVEAEAKDFQAEILAREAEDFSLLEALASEVSAELHDQLKKRKRLCLGLAVLMTLPAFGFFGNSNFVAIVAVVIAVYFAYLGITGSYWIKTKLDPDECVRALKKRAEQRSLRSKLERHSMAWENDQFSITRQVTADAAQDQLPLKTDTTS